MAAADKGLELAGSDKGLQQIMYLLSRIPLDARQQDFAAALRADGLNIGSSQPSMFEVLSGFADAVQRAVTDSGNRSDISEIAQTAATESLTAMCGERSETLFGASAESVQDAFRSFSTRNGFSDLAHDFFSRFTQKYLNYHLSRELSNHVGMNQRFSTPSEHNQFLQDLNVHSRQAALIVKEFAGDWFSKTNYESGITERKAANFAKVAMRKLRAEYKIRGARDAQ